MDDTMMKDNNGSMHTHEWCSCGCCHGHGMHGFHHRFFLLRWILGLLILAAVFCLGMKIGEFKGQYGYGFDGGRMMRTGNNVMFYRTGTPPGGMMQVWSSAQPVSGTAMPPTTNTVPTK